MHVDDYNLEDVLRKAIERIRSDKTEQTKVKGIAGGGENIDQTDVDEPTEHNSPKDPGYGGENWFSGSGSGGILSGSKYDLSCDKSSE